jgi:anti-sigma B factor antagonist
LRLLAARVSSQPGRLCFIPHKGRRFALARNASFALHEDAPDAATRVIAVEGEADMSTAVKFNESFFDAARTGTRAVVADLSAVRYIDTSMLNALVVGHRRMTRDRGRFAVVCANAQVGRVLEITGLGQILQVFDTREAALAHVQAHA